jgi:hypothetical protein
MPETRLFFATPELWKEEVREFSAEDVGLIWFGCDKDPREAIRRLTEHLRQPSLQLLGPQDYITDALSSEMVMGDADNTRKIHCLTVLFSADVDFPRLRQWRDCGDYGDNPSKQKFLNENPQLRDQWDVNKPFHPFSCKWMYEVLGAPIPKRLGL